MEYDETMEYDGEQVSRERTRQCFTLKQCIHTSQTGVLIHTERKNTSWWSIIYADAFKDKVLPSVKVTGAENRNQHQYCRNTRELVTIATYCIIFLSRSTVLLMLFLVQHEKIDMALLNKLQGPMNYKIGLIFLPNGHE